MNKIIVDCTTGETTEIPLTPEEIAELEAAAAQAQADRLAAEQKAAEDAAKKAALLAKLGITEDEAKLLLS